MGEQEKSSGFSNNFVWMFVIGVAFATDLLQIVLDLAFGAGIAVNRFVDIAAALLLISFILLTRAHMNTRSWISICAVFVGEMIPLVDVLPLWGLDVVYLWSLNSRSRLAQVAGTAVGGKFTKTTKLPPGAKPPPIPREIAPAGAAPPKITDVKPVQ